MLLLVVMRLHHLISIHCAICIATYGLFIDLLLAML